MRARIISADFDGAGPGEMTVTVACQSGKIGMWDVELIFPWELQPVVDWAEYVRDESDAHIHCGCAACQELLAIADRYWAELKNNEAGGESDDVSRRG